MENEKGPKTCKIRREQYNVPNGKLGKFSIINCNKTFLSEQTKEILRDTELRKPEIISRIVKMTELME